MKPKEFILYDNNDYAIFFNRHADALRSYRLVVRPSIEEEVK